MFEKGSENPSNKPPVIKEGKIVPTQGFNVKLYNQRYTPDGGDIYKRLGESSVLEYKGTLIDKEDNTITVDINTIDIDDSTKKVEAGFLSYRYPDGKLNI